MTFRRTLELAIVPALIAVAFVAPVVLWGDRLPDEVAVHWGLNGRPDRGDDVMTTLLLFLGLWGAFWAALVVLLQRRVVGGTEARWLTGSVYWMGGLFLLIWILGLRTSLDVADWRDSADLPAWQLFASMLAALPLGGLGWVLAGGRPPTSSSRGDAVEPLVAADGRSAVWSGAATNHLLTLVGFVPIAVTGVLALTVDQGWIALAIAALVGVLVTTIGSHVRATVGPHGVRVTMGWLGWPTRTVPLDQIEEVRVEDVTPLRYGGWGFRLVAGTQAHVIRSGPAIRVQRRDRSAVVVTVDDAERGAAILAGHLRMLGGAQSQAPDSRS